VGEDSEVSEDDGGDGSSEEWEGMSVKPEVNEGQEAEMGDHRRGRRLCEAKTL
jgi:hypothetical protein